ncbi:MAG: Uma2 family endonuclease [Microcoleaceae cyanobacterium]
MEIAAQLRNWVPPQKLGRITGSSAGFRLPNVDRDRDVRAPDAAFVRGDRLPQTTENYAELVPDLIFEVQSKIVTRIAFYILHYWVKSPIKNGYCYSSYLPEKKLL